MQQTYVCHSIVNLHGSLYAHPGDQLSFNHDTRTLSLYRGGDLMFTTTEVTSAAMKSMVGFKWFSDGSEPKKSTKAPAKVEGVIEEEVISDEEIEGLQNTDIEVADKVTVRDEWQEEETYDITGDQPVANSHEDEESLGVDLTGVGDIEVAPDLSKLKAPVSPKQPAPKAPVAPAKKATKAPRAAVTEPLSDEDEGEAEVFSIEPDENVKASQDGFSGTEEIIRMEAEPEVVKKKAKK